MGMILGGVADTSIPDYDTTDEYQEQKVYKNSISRQKYNNAHKRNMKENK